MGAGHEQGGDDAECAAAVEDMFRRKRAEIGDERRQVKCAARAAKKAADRFLEQ